METNNVARAEEYYKLVGAKNAAGIKKYLHADVELSGPMATLNGQEAVITATTNFMNQFKSLAIRAKFGAGSQAMMVYDLDIPGISNTFPGASLLSFRDGLIVKIELFYDASRFLEKKAEIFS